MNNSISLAPVWFVDVIGSALMIVFSFLAVSVAYRLRKLRPDYVIWTYLFWVCLSLAGFAISRGVGHIADRFLHMMNLEYLRLSLRPFSGSINSVAFIVVASVTLFFRRVHKINSEILNDKKALEQASGEVVRLNRDLEQLVKIRTNELAKSEKKYRRIFEASMDMIFILDAKGVFTDINSAGLTTLGVMSKDNLVGKSALKDFFLFSADYESFEADITKRGFVKDRECRLATEDGAEIYILLSATVRRNEKHEIVSYEGIAKDITARVQMERKLQQADRLASLGQISTGIAHEINNPLGVMLGYTQLLLREQTEGSQTHDDLKVIEKHARNCKTIVEDLLKFARGARTNKAPTNINACIREVVSLLSHQLELSGIQLGIDLDESLPEIIADHEKLKQVFMNLLMNAQQAVVRNGSISIRTSVESGKLVVRVQDSGCGIPTEMIDKIFDPFFSTKPVGEGTGLGLSLSYGIIRDHGGEINVESLQGHGTTFIIIFPSEQALENVLVYSRS